EAAWGVGQKDNDKTVKDAEAHAAEDKRRREEIERRNRLDTLVYEVEKSSKEWVDKLDAPLKTRLDKAVEGAKQALRSGAGDEISKALEELQQAYSAAGASLYAAQRGAGAPGGGGAEQPAGGDRLRLRPGVCVDPQSAEAERRGGDAGRATALVPAGPGGAGALGAGHQVGG